MNIAARTTTALHGLVHQNAKSKKNEKGNKESIDRNRLQKKQNISNKQEENKRLRGIAGITKGKSKRVREHHDP